jgi:chemotaxis protein CheC
VNDTAIQIVEPAVDRVRELTNIGAGHAATAFAALVGTPIRMRVPTVRILRAAAAGSAFVATANDDERRGMAGIFFEMEGGLGGVLALLFPIASRDRILEALTGSRPDALASEVAHSALREVGNILVSHVANAMADTLGTRILPSIPVLAMDDAISALASLVATRGMGDAALRIETEISDAEGRFRGVLAFVPDADAIAPRRPRTAVKIKPAKRS